MCMQSTHVRPYQRWHWAGDEIAHDTVILASRRIPGTKKRYDIDIREYLSIEDNAVIREHLERLWERLPKPQQGQFTSRKPGAFDLRARTVSGYVGALRYMHSGRKFDDWLFPDETLANGGGDCEDLAFLLAALLEASGISAYCIRVALGAVIDHRRPAHPRRWDHAWVVYQNEGGAWEILEPHALRYQARFRGRGPSVRRAPLIKRIHDIEYIPHFVFNRDHLWRVRTQEPYAGRLFRDYVTKDRKFWKRFEPSFAATVHWSIYDEALAGMSGAELDLVKATSLGVDVNVLEYDPREHFDFAYLDAGWERVQRRLSTGSLEDFALATHAIADFYAHSFYSDFARRRPDGSIEPYDPQHPIPQDALVYDFKPYAPLPGCASSTDAAEMHWKGGLISGQWWRWFTTFPGELKRASDFRWRRCLPDHDAVAVDGPERKAAHRHYSPAEYPGVFSRRRQAAIEHVRAAYRAWRH